MPRLSRLASLWVISLLTLSLVAPACVELAEDYPTPTPLPTPAETNKPIYEVKRGSIIQTVKGLGRVAASEEQTYFFKQSGRLAKLLVETGQKVKNGDLLAELETGTLKTQIAEAKLNVEVAELKLAQAADQSAGNTDVSSAAAAVARAEADFTKAQAALDDLRAGADTADLASAEQAVAKARADFEQAESDLAKLKNGPTEEDLRAAALSVEQARASLVATQIDRDSTCGRVQDPGHSSCVSANARVGSAEAALQKALAEEAEVKAGATPEEISIAERTVASTKAALTAAQAKLDQVKAGAKSAEIETAEKNLESAKAALDAAKANLALKVAAAAQGGDYDIQIQRKNVEMAKISLKELEEQLAMAQIKATFDGIVIQANGRDGDQVQAFTPVVTIANPKSLQIALEISPADLTKVQAEQEATIVLTDFPDQKFNGKVIGVPSQTASADPQLPATQRTVRLSFDAPPDVLQKLELGDLANVSIATLKKDDVLMLPNTAIRIFGGRRFVRLADTDGRKQEVDVEIGIADETMTEITKGLKEGQKVVAP